jgi:predicted nucleic acid-binding protein
VLILVDSSVVLDLVLNDPNWGAWSQAALDNMGADSQFVINDIVYAEVSIGYQSCAELDIAISALGLLMAPIPKEALFRAGKAFRKYKARSGTKTGVLPDFFIGAHAAVEGWPLLTRDPARIKSHFPTVELIAP